MRVKTASQLPGGTAVRIPALDRLAHSIVDRGAAPAAVCAAAYWDNSGWNWAAGSAGTMWPISSEPVSPESVFDLASVTKPFLAVAVATESCRGNLGWTSRLQDVFPEVQGTGGGKATLEELLSHRAGLLPHLELFGTWRAGRASTPGDLVRAAANATPKSGDPSCPHALYSDLGYLLVGAAVEYHFELPLDIWLSRVYPSLLTSELGSARNWLARDPAFLSRCAPTEVVPWRCGIVWGRVHDENAWCYGGLGLSGHAGLLGTAAGVVRFGAAMVDAHHGRESVVSAEAARLTTAARAGGSLRAGFDGKSAEGSSAGMSTSSDAFGHLGFTGTSLWCDPRRNLVAAVLTNRVCPSRENATLRGLRAELHEALFSWAWSARFGQPT